MIKKPKQKCSLPPYEMQEILSLQQAAQHVGWGITAFNLPSAWDKTKGEGVKIAVLDSGCDLTHSDLVENLLPGINLINRRKPPIDDNNHGCISPDCLIHTSYSGIDEIESLFDKIDVKSKIISSKDGKYEVKNTSDLDIKTYCFDVETQTTKIGKINSVQKLDINTQIICVELEGNIKYQLTPWHPVYLLKNKHHDVYEVERKRADEICVGDPFIFNIGDLSGKLGNKQTISLNKKYVCERCNHKPKWFRGLMPKVCKKCFYKKWIEINKEIEISPDLAYLAGITLTDGHISSDRIEISSTTLPILEKIKSITDHYKWTSVIENKRILIYGLEAVDCLNKLGIISGHKSLTQSLPEWVGKSDHESVNAFIAGVIDGDGCISKTNTGNRITSASYDFSRKICALLNSCGISASLSKPIYDNRVRKITSKHPCYKICHSALSDGIIQYLAHPEKIKRSKIKLSYQRKTRRVKSVTIENYNGYFYDFTVNEFHNYLAEGHFVSNTHVTGIICAKNNDFGMVGVAPECKVIPIKVLDSKGNGDLAIVAEGIRWAVDNGADILSMSLGSPRPLQNIRKAIQYAESKGIPVFVAAGNMGVSKEILYPANYKETISIGSIDENFDRSKFSNTGVNLDFMAPGGRIFSTVPENWYAILSGTSMAAPFAVGVAALCLSYQRKFKPNKPLLGSNAYRELFKKHVISINDVNLGNKKFYQGFGIIDVKELNKWISDD